ncbi:MAG: bifunctional diaminohydroxyphosphoribosylaminopyrimidine deaminase/5-amino-6-(5-phosphoribosylamino)uracil reductase RibD, partial [Candidatus Micrarchaeota archaeon]|nr:bifunctional diaminohydroxyphosphoribosylaminopyrimidine deaminase/5-amino-6-(5-phosphoribosylamino)uracil reductase RibD [Candidatus Micrarchaeota archaeon]
MNDDEKFMSRALLLASKGEGKVSPNPLVGAVVVKNGKIIGEGYHEFFGGPHAEVNALSGIDARGATLYITLEPCSHSGTGKKTPPCVPLIIKKGIKRVVIAADDRNPEVKGIEQLKFAGIRVQSGVLKKEAEQANEAFFKYITTGKPFVAIKMAQSAEGKIGYKGKSNVRISGKEFDAYNHLLRNRYDAILVGVGTVLADDPRLTCRMKGGRNPVRIILDSHLRTPTNAKVLHNAHEERVIIASVGFNLKKEESLKEKGAHVLICGRKKTDLGALIDSLPSLGIYSVLIEGGAHVIESALKGKFADKAILAV